MKRLLVTLLLASIALPFPASAGSGSISYYYDEYRNLIGRGQGERRQGIKTQKPFVGVTSHHLPTASPLIDNFYFQLRKKRPNIETFVIVGPDHFERCRQKFVTTNLPIDTMFGSLAIDKALTAELLKAGVRQESACFKGEHSIGVQANYIKKFFPQAKVAPVLLSYSATNRNFSEVIKVLKQKRDRVFVVQSTDFSHYLNVRQANAIDAISRRMITSLSANGFALKQVDSPASMKLILELAKAMKLKPEIIEHKNSFDYTGSFENTTSYFSVMF